MNRLNKLSVKVVSEESNSPSAALTLPILSRIEAMLGALVDTGQTDTIDLRREPLNPEDHAHLKELLGEGEVRALLYCHGLTCVQETAVSGVWWITHFDKDDNLQGEFIEVTTCPQMLMTSAEDLRSGQRLLHTRIARQSHIPDPSSINKSLQALGLSCNAISQTGPNINQPVKRGNSNAE